MSIVSDYKQLVNIEEKTRNLVNAMRHFTSSEDSELLLKADQILANVRLLGYFLTEETTDESKQAYLQNFIRNVYGKEI